MEIINKQTNGQQSSRESLAGGEPPVELSRLGSDSDPKPGSSSSRGCSTVSYSKAAKLRSANFFGVAPVVIFQCNEFHFDLEFSSAAQTAKLLLVTFNFILNLDKCWKNNNTLILSCKRNRRFLGALKSVEFVNKIVQKKAFVSGLGLKDDNE